MVTQTRRYLGALLAVFALVLSFLGLAQVVGPQAPAAAAPLSCPDPTTNVSNKVTLDWDNAQLVDDAGRETRAVGDCRGTPRAALRRATTLPTARRSSTPRRGSPSCVPTSLVSLTSPPTMASSSGVAHGLLTER